MIYVEGVDVLTKKYFFRRMKTLKALDSPTAIPRNVRLACYFFSVCVTGMAVGAADPLQQMMKLNGAYADIEDEHERMCTISKVVSYGFSWCMLTGVFVSPTIDALGSKLTALLGLSLHTLGYVLLFFVNSSLAYYVANVAFGFGYQCILNSHMIVGCLFPKAPNLVLAILGAAPDLSLLFPPALRSAAEKIGDESTGVKRAVLVYLIGFVGAAALLDAFLVPWDTFELPSPAGSKAKNEVLSNDQIILVDDQQKEPFSNEATSLVPQASSLKKENQSLHDGMAKRPSPYFGNLSLGQQLLTPDYWIFIVFAIMTVLRKKYVATAIRFIFEEIDSSPSKANAALYTNFYNLFVPFGCIPAIMWGALVDRLGIKFLLFVSNTLAIVYTTLALIPSITVQAGTFFVFIVYQSFVFGQLLAFCISMYGFRTLVSLQGIATTLFGLSSLFMDAVLYPYITNVLKSHWKANIIVLCISVLAYSLLVVLVCFAKRRLSQNLIYLTAPSVTEDAVTALRRATTEAPLRRRVSSFDLLLPMTTCYERRSLQLLGELKTAS